MNKDIQIQFETIVESGVWRGKQKTKGNLMRRFAKQKYEFIYEVVDRKTNVPRVR